MTDFSELFADYPFAPSDKRDACQSCSMQTATVHLTAIMDKKKYEIDICRDCAAEQRLMAKRQQKDVE